MNWPVKTNFETPTGIVLQRLGAALERPVELIVFGSGALELTVCPKILSVDVDVSLDLTMRRTKPGETPFLEDDLRKVAHKAGIDATTPHLQVCFYDTFKSPKKWEGRCAGDRTGNAILTIPHPLDILYAKMHRLEEKDLKAFHLVREATGSPTSEEMLSLCQENFRDFLRLSPREAHLVSSVRPGNLRRNAQRVWKEVFDQTLSIQNQILIPGDAKAREPFPPQTDRLRKKLKKLGNLDTHA